MQIDDKKKLAEKHFESANSRASTAAKTGFAILVALVLLWKSNIEPVVPTLHEAAERAKVVRTFGTYLQSTRIEKQKYSDKRVATTRNYNDEFSALAAKLKKTEVDFKVPGFDSFKVPLKYAALVFNTLFLAVIGYMLAARIEIRALLARGARLATDTSEGSESLIRPNVVFFIPWWVAPLPSRPGTKVQHSHILDLVDWRASHRVFVTALAVFLIGLCAVQIRVCLISLLSAYSFSQIEPASSAYAVAAASVFLTALTLACAARWLLPGRVPDELFNEAAPSVGRRSLAATLLLAGGTALLAVKFPRTFIRPIRAPRYVAKRKGAPAFIDLPVGLYLNRRSRRIHYVSQESPTSSRARLVAVRTSRSRAPRSKNFEQIRDDIALAGPDLSRINFVGRSAIVEKVAADMRKAGQLGAACSLLLAAVLDDLRGLSRSASRSPAMRLYYLLARYSIQAKDDTWLKKMIDAISQNGMLVRFQAPIASWTDPNKRWQKRLRHEK